MVLVSACLLGFRCKYNGNHNYRSEILRLNDAGLLIPVCPEEMGGLPTPRPPARFDIADGEAVLDGLAEIVDVRGRDVTGFFLEGARKTLEIAKKHGIRKAVLKERSPSCGTHRVYIMQEGSEPVPGKGVTAALLQKHGIATYSDERLDSFN